MWHILIVQPCLAFFMSARIMADTYSSFFTELIWLLVAILWGTLKTRVATAQLPQDMFEQENDWTFGQIVPVLLLAVPIFATIIHLTFNWSNPDYSDRPHHCMPSFEICRSYPFATHSSELPEDLTATYTSRTRWLWPSLVGLFVSTTYFTHEAFSQNFDFDQGLKADGSLVDVWITRYGLLWYMILGLPRTLSNTVAIGLALDAWFESRSKLGWMYDRYGAKKQPQLSPVRKERYGGLPQGWKFKFMGWSNLTDKGIQDRVDGVWVEYELTVKTEYSL
ncbi:hypothetical protein FJTKL_09763 [Diaporthe vaccinii]|uniref:Uncharacterized protein n=1 Tax=Diaporthe vaccinii TaxID=105482 RepID=A0ABR4EN37_9PEZI